MIALHRFSLFSAIQNPFVTYSNQNIFRVNMFPGKTALAASLPHVPSWTMACLLLTLAISPKVVSTLRMQKQYS